MRDRFPAKLTPVAHGGMGGDLGSMHKVMDVQARLVKRMKVPRRKDEEKVTAVEKTVTERDRNRN